MYPQMNVVEMHKTTAKNYMAQLLGRLGAKHRATIERVMQPLAVPEDVAAVTQLFYETYLMGFNKAVEECQVQMRKLGVTIEIGQKVTQNSG